MDDQYYNQNAEMHFQEDELYELTIDKQRYQQTYDKLIEQIDSIIQDEEKEKIVNLVHKLIEVTSKQLKLIGQNCTKNIGVFMMKIKEKQQLITNHQETIESLNQSNDILQVKIQNWQQQFESLKAQNHEIVQKYEKRLKQIKKEKKEIKQTFRIVQQNTQIQRMLLENLQLEKQQINQLILSQKKQKKQLMDELTQVKQKTEEIQLRLIAANNKIAYFDRQIKTLQQQIKQKDEKIRFLQKEIYLIHKNQEEEHDNEVKQKFQQQKLSISLNKNQSIQDKSNEQQSRKISSFVQINPLSDQINGFQYYQVGKSFVSVARSDSKSATDYEAINKSEIIEQTQQKAEENNIKIQKIQKMPTQFRASQINIPNFYFAHYLLTCQSMKLKLNSEEYLCVDMAKYYKDVLEAKIPFHMWDQWIVDKLKKIACEQ